ncbi:hypothetical protein ABL78_0722 [Leptomonas seymouri]|uniref:Uncharacterized protein n=1 Tax=Leptomonas seymouri TaxID=5684 RepID=A0A0N1PDE9_LEPSE|nr:hypothetical protein ABL78_0722 [Leptomonas seymouri]|eukprot:KPI90204.1 hypothetical protein ABL78_0722 [Leptomonas seymouri]
MVSSDASVSVLMDRISEVEKQRRVLSMRQKELEAKVAFATAEKADLLREAKAMDDEEAQLKGDLETLAAEELRLEVQIVEVTDHLRRTEEEEAVHTTVANAEQEAVAKERASWQEKAEELEKLRRTWENDPATSSCIASLRGEMELLTSIKAEREALGLRKAELEAAIERMRAEQQAYLASAGVSKDSGAVTATTVELLSLQAHSSGEPSSTGVAPSSPSATPASAAVANSETSVQSLEEEMRKAEYEWTQIAARHALTMSSLQREVDALSSRATELQELLTEVQSTREAVSRRAEQLQQCLAKGLCVRCSL